MVSDICVILVFFFFVGRVAEGYRSVAGENNRFQVKFNDPKVCKSFLLGCCPHEILSSTVGGAFVSYFVFIVGIIVCCVFTYCANTTLRKISVVGSVLTNVADVFSENNKLLLYDEGLDVFCVCKY